MKAYGDIYVANTKMQNITYRRHLPHIHPDNHPLFITFSLADSLPVQVFICLREELEELLKTVSNVSERNDIKRNYFNRYDDLLDHQGFDPRWLENETIADIVASKISSMANHYFELFAYCIMPTHVHLLMQPCDMRPAKHGGRSAKYPATEILRLLKGSTARHCNLELNRTGRFWHHESYDHFVRDEEEMERIIKYILQNPVKAGLAKEWTDWKYTYVNPKLGSW
jgi:REP element-mobilizing transposase RayT